MKVIEKLDLVTSPCKYNVLEPDGFICNITIMLRFKVIQRKKVPGVI